MRLDYSAALAASCAVLFGRASAQTFTDCNPLNTQCPPDAALGITINVDFRKGGVNSFVPFGSPTYSDENGASFTVKQGGDAPQLQSVFYIMFGRVEITMKAAPGAGIVSSLVLESDCLDEIDIEWLGSNPNEMQSNYFGKGQTTSYNRGQFHTVDDTQGKWITYTVDWTQDRIVWMADGTVVRELKASDAEANQYPQTPMQVKFGSWAGGDPAHNPPGTVEWARGPTDYSKGPFSMYVQKIIVTDYSTGKEYKYGDNSGSWESIQAVDGKINGNVGNNAGVTVTASAAGSEATSDAGVPQGGLGEDGSDATATQTGWPWERTAGADSGSIPDGWTMTEEGKLIPKGSSPGLRPAFTTGLFIPLAMLLLGHLV